jgi:hypothetical protein
MPKKFDSLSENDPDQDRFANRPMIESERSEKEEIEVKDLMTK